MRYRLRLILMHRLQLRESWIIFFILGFILINFPFLHIFNKSCIVLGFPLLFLYLFSGWGISIFIIYLFTLAIGNTDAKPREKHKP